MENQQRRELQGLLPKGMEGVSIPGTYYSARDAAMALSKCASLPYILPQAPLDNFKNCVLSLYNRPSC